MKIICAVLLAVTFTFELRAQTNFYQSHSNLQPLRIKSSDKNSQSVFNVGLEFGKLDILTEKYQYFHAFGIYFDFNVWNKKLYTEIDLGGFTDRDFHSGVAFAGLGLNYKFFGYGRHNFYFYSGFEGMGGYYYAAVAFVVNPKYVFSLNKHIGISGGIRYMERIGYTQRFLIYSAGIQFSFL